MNLIWELILDRFGTVLRPFWDRFRFVLGPFWDRVGIVFGYFFNFVSDDTAADLKDPPRLLSSWGVVEGAPQARPKTTSDFRNVWSSLGPLHVCFLWLLSWGLSDLFGHGCDA